MSFKRDDLTAVLAEKGLKPKEVTELLYEVLERFIASMLAGTVFVEGKTAKISPYDLGVNIVKAIVDLKLDIASFPYNPHDVSSVSSIIAGGSNNFRCSKIRKKRIDPDYSRMPVIQYTKEGQFIKRHESIATATDELGINSYSIYRVCIGELKSTGGYRWMMETPGEQPPLSIGPSLAHLNSKPVEQLNKDGVLIKRFTAVTEAERCTGEDRSTIRRACLSGKTTLKGFRWRNSAPSRK